MKAHRLPLPPRQRQHRATTTYDDIVRGQVIDALMTNQGERVLRPRYGCDIQAALFDPRDELVRKDAAGTIKPAPGDVRPTVHREDIHIELPAGTTRVDVIIVYRASAFGTDITLTRADLGSEFANRALVAPEVETVSDVGVLDRPR